MSHESTHHHDSAETAAPEATEPRAPGAGGSEAEPEAATADGWLPPTPGSPEADAENAAAEGDPDPGAGAPTGAADDDLAARAARADEYLALAQRKQAEFENYRKRAARESAAARERGASGLARELLPAIDNLERALQHAPAEDDPHGFTAGVRHVHADLVAALGRAGIDQFSPEGEPFDPTQHEAVAQQPAGEGVAAGTVLEVFQRGYRAGETVVRPARVVVAG